eukprot:m.162937 g.162937  ORF g.162937 m.162937 type:complete len:84 (+) comp15208_c0_seq6:4770-5021(+)
MDRGDFSRSWAGTRKLVAVQLNVHIANVTYTTTAAPLLVTDVVMKESVGHVQQARILTIVILSMLCECVPKCVTNTKNVHGDN